MTTPCAPAWRRLEAAAQSSNAAEVSALAASLPRTSLRQHVLAPYQRSRPRPHPAPRPAPRCCAPTDACPLGKEQRHRPRPPRRRTPQAGTPPAPATRTARLGPARAAAQPAARCAPPPRAAGTPRRLARTPRPLRQHPRHARRSTCAAEPNASGRRAAWRAAKKGETRGAASTHLAAPSASTRGAWRAAACCRPAPRAAAAAVAAALVRGALCCWRSPLCRDGRREPRRLPHSRPYRQSWRLRGLAPAVVVAAEARWVQACCGARCRPRPRVCVRGAAGAGRRRAAWPRPC